MAVLSSGKGFGVWQTCVWPLQPVSVVESQFSKAGWEKAQTRLESWQAGSRSGQPMPAGGGRQSQHADQKMSSKTRRSCEEP